MGNNFNGERGAGGGGKGGGVAALKRYCKSYWVP